MLLAVLCGGVAVVALAGGGDDDRDAQLTVERSVVPGTQQPELLVSVDRKLNVPATARDGRTVNLQCLDARKRRVLNARVDWPFLEEPNYPLPHTHQPVSSKDLSQISSCRLGRTTVALSGRMRLRN